MEIIVKKINEIKPYDKNPRKNEKAVEKVAASIQEFGFQQPIVVDSDFVIIVGHTRFKAAKMLGYDEVPVVIADKLTPEQAKAYRIIDNKTSEYAEWDMDLFGNEIRELAELGYQFDSLGFDDISDGFEEEEAINNYSEKIKAPTYEITKDKPEAELLCDTGKYDELIAKINASSVDEDAKKFLRLAATRHIVFDYQEIAEFYAHSGKEVQELMEQSALVIIDFDKAIENGFVDFTESLFEDEGDLDA